MHRRLNDSSIHNVRYYARHLSVAERLRFILAEFSLVRRSAENKIRKQNYNRQSGNQHGVEVKLNPGAGPVTGIPPRRVGHFQRAEYFLA
jgi:hypothetical protein